MATNTYYFDASIAGPTDADAIWTNDANAFDGSTSTVATAGNGAGAIGSESSKFLYGAGTTAPTSGSNITQVRARIYHSPQNNAGSFTGVTKIYTASLAETIGTITTSSTSAGYIAYVTLSTPSGGWTWTKVNELEVKTYQTASSAANEQMAVIEVEVTSVDLSTVTTQAVSSIAQTTATGNGNITALGGENATNRGFVWDTSTKSAPGNVAPGSSGYANNVTDAGSHSTGAFTGSLTSLSATTTYYVRAWAQNSAGYTYGDEVNFTTLSNGLQLSNISSITNISTMTA